MIEIGKLYTLAKDPTISSYAMNDTYIPTKKKITDWIKAEKFDHPFLVVDCYSKNDHHWIQVVIEDKTGWIYIPKEQLRIYKPYR